MLKRSLFSIFHADNTSDSVFSIFFRSHSVFSIFNVRLRVFHILYSVFSIFCTPCFPYFILRVFHFLTSHSGAPTPRLRNSDSGTPAPCFPFNPGLIFPKKMSLQQLWRNVNLGLRASNRHQWNYITFFPQSFL